MRPFALSAQSLFSRILLLWILSFQAALAVGTVDELPAPLQDFIAVEQGRMSRAVDTSKLVSPNLSNQDPLFAPESRGIFKVKTYWIDESKFDHFQAEAISPGVRDSVTRKGEDGKRQIRLIVHPESKDFYQEFLKNAQPGEDLWATATSSSRTVVVWNENTKPFFAKLSLDRKIGGAKRTLPLSEVPRSLGTMAILDASRDSLPSTFHFFPETFGIHPAEMARGGMIIREIPAELLSGEKKYIPLFSLYAAPPEGPKPYLLEMIQKSGQMPSEFIHERIIAPFAKQWVDLALNQGITVEAHAQNTLIELGRDGLPNGNYMFRDLAGFDIDINYRKKLGLPLPEKLPVIGSFTDEYHQREISGALKRSLYNHYGGGFLYNLDKSIIDWERAGMLPDEFLGKESFTRMLIRELKVSYEKETGIKMGPISSLKNFGPYIKKAKAKKISALTPEKGGISLGCSSMFGRLRSFFTEGPTGIKNLSE